MASNDLSSGFNEPDGRRKRSDVSMSKDDSFTISTSNSSIKKPRTPSKKSKSTSKDYHSFLTMDGSELSAEDLRCFVPKMMKKLYRQNEDANTDGKKFKGLWDQRPDDWDPEVPFVDPNNCQNKECAKDSQPCKKPWKKTNARMFNFLRDKICKAGYQATPNLVVSDLTTKCSWENTASGSTSGQYSSASGLGFSVAHGRRQSGLSSDYSHTTDPPSGYGQDGYSSGFHSGVSHDNGFGGETVRQEKPAGYQAMPDFVVSDLQTKSSRQNAASGSTSGQYSSASGFGSAVAYGRRQSGFSSDYSHTTDPPSGYGQDVYSSGLHSGLSHNNEVGVETVRQEKPVSADMNYVAVYQPESQRPDLVRLALQAAVFNDGPNSGPLLDMLNGDPTNYCCNNSMRPASGDQEVLYQTQTQMQLEQEDQQVSDGFTGVTVAHSSSWPTQMAATPNVDVSASQNSAAATTSRKVVRRKKLMDEVVSEWNTFRREQLVSRDVEMGLFGQQILAILQQLSSNSKSQDFWRFAHAFLGLIQRIMDQMEDDAISLAMVSSQINAFDSKCI